MKEVHTKIVIDFTFNKNGVDIQTTSDVKELDVMQKAFITLIYNRICDVLKDADPIKNKTRCRDLDKLDNMLDDLIDDLFKRLEKRK